MKLSKGFVLLALYSSSAAAAWGSSKPAYSKWHERELQTWLADNNIPFPESAQKTDLEKLVKDNWNDKVYRPYQEWSPSQLQKYLKAKGIQVEDKVINDKNWLVNTVKSNWHDTEAVVEKQFDDIKNWIFDSWTESQLKAFLDRHGIPNPTPRTRDTLLKAARENYQSIAQKTNQNYYYPGNWLYQQWSESELKRWLDERGYDVPQPTTRDKLIAAVRRNSRMASLRMQEFQGAINDKVLSEWSDSKIEDFLKARGINVPKGSNRKELLAIAKEHKAKLSKTSADASASLASAYGAATSNVEQQYAQATDTAHGYGEAAFNKAIELWSDSRLKYFLESRGVDVPQYSKRDELLAYVRANRNKMQNKYGVWTFQDWSVENLKKWLESQGHKTVDSATATRDELIGSANSALSSAQSAGENAYATVTSAIASATNSVKQDAFDTWSDSELKNYLDSYGIGVYQGSTRNELLAEVRRQAHLFRNGGKEPNAWDKSVGFMGWVKQKAWEIVGFGQGKTKDVQDVAQDKVEEVKLKTEEVKEKAQEGAGRARTEL